MEAHYDEDTLVQGQRRSAERRLDTCRAGQYGYSGRAGTRRPAYPARRAHQAARKQLFPEGGLIMIPGRNLLTMMKPHRFINPWKAIAVNMIANRLGKQDILLDVDVSSKDGLFDAIGRHMEQEYSLSREAVSSSLGRRELLGSTGLGDGFAIPHARVRNLDQIRIAYLRLKSPIPFDAADGNPVFDILVLLVPKEAADEHLQVLAEASRMFDDKRFRARLKQCRDPAEAKHLFDSRHPSSSWFH
jgi:PTS system nitrogen regulatory IIA component